MSQALSHVSHILPSGTILQDNYIVDSLLGKGGFGITYSGTCISSGQRLAIKEYFPAGLSTREYVDGRPMVSHFQGSLEMSFRKGLKRFLNEASILQDFYELSSIVSVLDVFEENGTAYLVMEYIEGITLKQYIADNGTLPFSELLNLVTPVIHAMKKIHDSGLIHRDISPDNLMVGLDNQLHLIDFGAASNENPNETKTMTVILKSGYAPPEQYLADGRIGSWTDVYGLCATMYYALTAATPPESIRRIQNDTLAPLSEQTAITSWQAKAIEKGMQLKVAERFRNMEQLYLALTTKPSIEENETVTPDVISKNLQENIRKLSQRHPGSSSGHAPLSHSGKDAAVNDTSADTQAEQVSLSGAKTEAADDHMPAAPPASTKPVRNSFQKETALTNSPGNAQHIFPTQPPIPDFGKRSVFHKSQSHTAARSWLRTAVPILILFLLAGYLGTGGRLLFQPDTFSLSSVQTPAPITDFASLALLEASLSTGQQAAAASFATAEANSRIATDDDNILTMINMVGDTLEDAANALSQLDDAIQVTTLQEYSDEYASGMVISQSIPDDTQFTKGRITNIVLTVSMGSAPAAQARQSSSSSGNNSSDSDYKVNGSDETTTKKDDGYTTIHLE